MNNSLNGDFDSPFITSTVAQVKILLQSHPELIETANKEGQTPLLAAAANKSWAIASYLIEAGANINAQDNVCLNFRMMYFIFHQMECFVFLVGLWLSGGFYSSASGLQG
jgi:ankyrin repeat protein